jgi:putative oxidoreductase
MALAQTADRYTPYVLSLLRIMAALLLLQHGLSKFFGFPMAMQTPALFSLYWFAGVIELVFGTLLLIGLFSRCAAFILSGELAFAYFIGHAPRGFFPLTNNGEVAVLFCFVFLTLAFAGGGAWSVDALWRKR